MIDKLEKVDWQRVCLDIRSSGLPLSTAAVQVGMSWKTLGHLARGEQRVPRFDGGLRLLKLHAQRCPERSIL